MKKKEVMQEISLLEQQNINAGSIEQSLWGLIINIIKGDFSPKL